METNRASGNRERYHQLPGPPGVFQVWDAGAVQHAHVQSLEGSSNRPDSLGATSRHQHHTISTRQGHDQEAQPFDGQESGGTAAVTRVSAGIAQGNIKDHLAPGVTGTTTLSAGTSVGEAMRHFGIYRNDNDDQTMGDANRRVEEEVIEACERFHLPFADSSNDGPVCLCSEAESELELNDDDSLSESRTSLPGVRSSPGHHKSVSMTPAGQEEEEDSQGDEEVPGLGGTVLAGLDDFTNTIQSVNEAKQYLNQTRHQVAVARDDFGEVEARPLFWGRRIFVAMVTLPDDATDTSRATFETIRRKGFEQKYIEARSIEIVGRVIEIHKHGSALLPKVQLKGKTIERHKASVRLEKLIDMLYSHKTIVKDILDGWKVDVIVDQPEDRLKKALASESTNKGKKLKKQEIERSLADMKAAAGHQA